MTTVGATAWRGWAGVFGRLASSWSFLFLLLIGARLGAGELRIATYNLANYTLADRRIEDGFRPDYPKPEAEKAALRRVIAAMDADVIALQEIGGAPFLAELRRDLASEGLEYPYGEAPVGADAERGLAVLSRVPLGSVALHRDLVARRRGNGGAGGVGAVGAAGESGAAGGAAEPVRRGLLQVEVPTPDGVVTLFVVHLKSRIAESSSDPAAEEQRVAEAQAVRDRVLELFPEPAGGSGSGARARFVIVGDFNDSPGSRALRAVQARGKTEIARWVDAADERGQRWTHAYERLAVYSRFDHALVSPALWGEAGDGVRARIVGEPWEAVRTASDHRPVLLSLALGE